MSENRARRRRQFIDRDVQGTLVFRLALYWCAFLTVGMSVSLVLQYFADPFKPLEDHFRLFATNQAGFLLAMVCLTPVFFFDTVKLSHRFAGPILRVRRTLSDLARGEEVRPVKFRPGDFWADIADDLNKVAELVTSPGAHHEQGADTNSAPSDASVRSVLDEVGQV